MFSRIAVGVLALLIAAAGLPAQTTRPAQIPFTGVLAGRDVYVRSGPGLPYYPCAKLSYPARVRVVGRDGEWAKILPPRVCFSVISKDYVRRDGVKGKVTGTNVRVRAGSSVLPRRTDHIQTRLNVGAEVTILGEQGDFYKIVPPAGVCLWVSWPYVKPMGSILLTTLPTQPTVTTDVTTTRTVLVAPRQVDQLAKEKAEFEAVEMALRKEFQKPREQRNVATLLDRYKGIALSADSPLAPFVAARVTFLQDEIDLAGEMQAADQLIRETDTARAELAAGREKVRTDIPSLRPRKTYAVEGTLFASGVFVGGATGPKRYVVGNADRSRVYAYLECTTGVADLASHVGAHVGVVGIPRYDEKSGLYVVEVEQIVVLRPPATRPAVMGKPAPSTQPAPAPGSSTVPKRTAPRTPAAPAASTRPAARPKPRARLPMPAPGARAKEPETGQDRKPPDETVAHAAAPSAKPGAEPKPEKPLPPTGLPVAETTTKPSSKSTVNPKEYE